MLIVVKNTISINKILKNLKNKAKNPFQNLKKKKKNTTFTLQENQVIQRTIYHKKSHKL